MKFSLAVLLFVLCIHAASGQALLQHSDSAKALQTDSTTHITNSIYGNLLDSSRFLNTKGNPESLQVFKVHNNNNTNVLFYVVALLLLIFGLIRSFYNHYFSTLFRVFFNTTLKQNQLTDQLEQAKLPSLIFNILFVLASGFYIFCLIQFHKWQHITISQSNYWQLIFCILFVLICYVIKYWGLLFLGWLTDYNNEAKSYIFIIFLLNKIIGVLLLATLPFLIFANDGVKHYIILYSIIAVLLLLIMRYYRSFSILQDKLKISTLHFLLYVIALELIPLLIIFKYCNAFLTTKA